MDSKTFFAHLAKETGRQTSEIDKLTEAMTATLTTVLSELNSAAIPGFGTFEAEKTDERVVTENGKRILMPPAITIKFNPSVVLRNKLKQQ